MFVQKEVEEELVRVGRAFLDSMAEGNYDTVWDRLITAKAAKLLSTALLPVNAYKEDGLDEVLKLIADADIEMSNHFTSTWPGSIFRTHRMCAFPKQWGRVTLTDMELTLHRNGRSTGTTLTPGPSYMEALAEHFRLFLDTKFEDFIL